MQRCASFIEDLLPHRDDMLLIEEILEVDRQKAVTRSVVAQRWPLVAENGASSIISVELVAQTAGICNGWINRQKHGHSFSRRGWLVGVKKASFYAEIIPLHATVITTARNNYKFETFREVSGTVQTGSEVIARITLQLFQPKSHAGHKSAKTVSTTYGKY